MERNYLNHLITFNDHSTKKVYGKFGSYHENMVYFKNEDEEIILFVSLTNVLYIEPIKGDFEK